MHEGTADFTTQGGARSVAEALNGKLIGGREIVVRLDFDEHSDDADAEDGEEVSEDGVLGRVRGWTAGRIEGEFAAPTLEPLLAKLCVRLWRRRRRGKLLSPVPLRVSVGDFGGGLVPLLVVAALALAAPPGIVGEKHMLRKRAGPKVGSCKNLPRHRRRGS